MSCTSVLTRLALVSLVNGAVNVPHVGYQFGCVGKRLAAHRAVAGCQRPTLLGVTLHVPIHRHLSGGLELTEAALELLDGNLVDTANVLLKQPSVFGDVTALTTFVAWLGAARSFVAVDVLDVDVHVLLPGAFVVAVRTVKGLESFMH